MAHLNNDMTNNGAIPNIDPLKQYIGNDTSVHVLDAQYNADGSVNALLQGDRFDKQIHTQMPDGSPAANRLYPILPPVAVQYPDFLKACTNCGKCIDACPEHILRPAKKEYEVYGIQDASGKPTMSFEMGYCRTNCHKCVDVCPEGILLKGEREKEKEKGKGDERREKGEMPDRQIRPGWAQFNSRTCVTQTDGVPCDACARHCPTKAIRQTDLNGQAVPSINTQTCIGCGACEFYCPARPKAIYIEGM